MGSDFQLINPRREPRPKGLDFFQHLALPISTALIWMLFCFSASFLSKETRVGVIFVYSIFWLLMLWLKPNTQKWMSWWWLWLLTRLCCFFSEPFYENDYYRYLWDGIVTAAGENALIIAPLEVLEGHPVFGLELGASLQRQSKIDVRAELLPRRELEELLKRINFSESPSIYGPFAQIVLALQTWPFKLYRLWNPDASIELAWRVQFLRFTLILIDLLSCFILFKLLRSLKREESWFGIYLLCPVLLKEVGNSLHIDLLSTLCLMLSLLVMLKKKDGYCGILLAFAASVKPFAIVMLPFYLIWTRSKNLFFGFCLSLGLLYLPYVMTGGKEIWVGTQYFSNLWSMNDVFPALWRELLYRTIEHSWQAVESYPIGVYEVSQVQWWSRFISLGFFVGVYVLLLIYTFKTKSHSLFHKIKMCAWVTFSVVWFSPVQNPWYYLWGLPFFIMSARHTILILMGLSQLYLLNFYFKPTSHLFAPFQWWVIVPQLCAMLYWFLYRKNGEIEEQPNLMLP